MSRLEAKRAPILRLVGGQEPPATPAEATRPGHARDARRAVARENQLAATISTYDARWIFAVDIASSLVGGRSALLPAKTRKRLLARAAALGMRPFDANLVIAVVQDAQREGRALSRDTQERLLLIRPADPDLAASPGTKFVIALILAAVLMQAWAVWFFNH
mgnify:CR=1 FL=1